MKKWLAITTLSLIYLNSGNASHVRGGGIYWNCLGNGQYQFEVLIFTDCFSTGLYVTELNGPFGVMPLTLDSAGSSQIVSSCTNNCVQEVMRFKTAPVSLSGTPPANGWEFYIDECCRDVAENLSLSGNFFLNAKMYAYTPAGASGPLTADSCFSSSPRYASPQGMMHCDGPYSSSVAPYDLDADSIGMELSTPLLGPNLGTVTYASGFSFDKPFPDQSENPLNGPNSFNPNTGRISMEFYQATPGFYTSAIAFKEYRQGQLLSESILEIPLEILDSATCAPAANNDAPSLSISSNNSLSIDTTTGVNRMTMMSGDTINLNLQTTDFNTNPNGTFQTICLKAYSNQMNSANPAVDTGCGSPSCATLVPLGSSTSYCNTLTGRYTFQWVPDCRMINNQSHSPLTYRFHFIVEDNGCPLPKLDQATLLVDLYPGPLFAPELSIDAADTNGNVDLSWTKVQIAPNSPFDRYVIYSRAVGGTFIPLDSIYDIDSLQASYSGLPYPSQFFIKAFAGTCRYGSPASSVKTSSVNIGLEEWFSNPYFSFAPNPAQNRIRVDWKEADMLREEGQVLIFDKSGKMLKEYVLEAHRKTWTLDLDLSPGLYILEVRGKGSRFQDRLLIE